MLACPFPTILVLIRLKSLSLYPIIILLLKVSSVRNHQIYAHFSIIMIYAWHSNDTKWHREPAIFHINVRLSQHLYPIIATI